MNETKAEEEVTVGKLAQDFKVVIRDAEALIRATAGDLGEKAREARGRLTASLESAKSGFSQVEDKAIASAKATDKVIREHPYESVGVAFGLGLLIGVLVARR
jgi:ElaB/YqjD/DUF883 family membrane-anchored ribosome-binding protein